MMPLCSISASRDTLPFISWLSSKSPYICFLSASAVEQRSYYLFMVYVLACGRVQKQYHCKAIIWTLMLAEISICFFFQQQPEEMEFALPPLQWQKQHQVKQHPNTQALISSLWLNWKWHIAANQYTNHCCHGNILNELSPFLLVPQTVNDTMRHFVCWSHPVCIYRIM